MATPKQTAAGSWRVQIEVRGVRDAATLPTKRQAVEWAAKRKGQLLEQNSQSPGQFKTMADAMARYAVEVSPTKRGVAFEQGRLRALVRQNAFPAQCLLCHITPQHWATWRDSRLQVVKAASVLRDMVLLSHVLEVARREWQWIEKNTMRDVRRPASPPHRDRVIAHWEVRRMLRAMHWSRRAPVRSKTQAMAWCFVLALQTGMRLGELCGLRWDDVCADHVLLRSGKTKSGKARAVPLTRTAQRCIAAMRSFDAVRVFGINATSTGAMFCRLRQHIGLHGFTFHDARHTAATRLAPVLDVLTLCKMFGWANTTRALTYYNPTASQIAARLNALNAAPRTPAAAPSA